MNHESYRRAPDSDGFHRIRLEDDVRFIIPFLFCLSLTIVQVRK